MTYVVEGNGNPLQYSFKALAGKVLTLPSEDSFPRPRGLLISPLSTGLCPPAASLRSCTEHWPPSTARTGEAPPLAGGPVCLNPPSKASLTGGSHRGWVQAGLIALLSLSWNSQLLYVKIKAVALMLLTNGDTASATAC